MTHASKGWALRVLTTGAVSRVFHPLMGGRCTVFMLHRFQAPALGVPEGHDPETLRRTLELLRRRRYQILSLGDLFRRLEGGGGSIRRTVAFTIDDGYVEQGSIAGPIFAAYDCPVTTFVTTGFLDRQLWFWWDQVAFVFRHTTRSRVRVALPDATKDWRWSTRGEREQARAEFTGWCKTLPDGVKYSAIAALATEAGVTLPSAAPAEYAPMTWDDVRARERHGMSFGPHTVTHPILSRTTDDASRYEIEESWRRLRAEARDPVDVFCYPNGGWDDFGEREVSTLRRLGLRGAVVGVPGFAQRDPRPRELLHPYAVRRMPYPDDVAHTVQYVCGLERFKMLLRRMDS